MTYFNSDGSRAAMCGNAALCSTRLAVVLGLVSDRMQLEADAATYEARALSVADTAEIHLAPVAAPSTPRITLAQGEKRIGFATVGVPHLAVVVEDLDAVDLTRRGRALRHDSVLGTAGANVNFIAPVDGHGAWAMRTYERGVEGETLACGTGAVAAACILREWRLADLPVTIVARTGLPLTVRAVRGRDGIYEDVWLEGQARMVFRGVLTG
jgi:diaminopimelate epimerase